MRANDLTIAGDYKGSVVYLLEAAYGLNSKVAEHMSPKQVEELLRGIKFEQ
jgi:hypothetical protein